ncbi:MAG: hypothetical protein ACXVQS_01705 [Actinomycetota bacterium]
MRPRRALLLLALAALLACVACPSKKQTPRAQASPSTSVAADADAFQFQQQVLDAIRAKGSFHLHAIASQQGQSAIFDQDVGTTQGTQRITIGAQRAEIRMIGTRLYLFANRAALAQFMGFPAQLATRLQDRWVSFAPTDAPYKDIAASLTLDSAMTEIAMSGTLAKTSETTIDGVRVVGLTGTANGGGAETLYVHATGDPLPVSERVSDQGNSVTTTFSAWGEPVNVATPKGSVSYLSVAGSSGGTQA